MTNKTAVEWLVEQLTPMNWTKEYMLDYNKEIIEQAKEMEKQQSHEYAEFAIRCDRMGMKILNFEDWLKLETFKTE